MLNITYSEVVDIFFRFNYSVLVFMYNETWSISLDFCPYNPDHYNILRYVF